MRAIRAAIHPGALDPAVHDARILARRQVRLIVDAARKYVGASIRRARFEPVLQPGAGPFRDLKLNRTVRRAPNFRGLSATAGLSHRGRPRRSGCRGNDATAAVFQPEPLREETIARAARAVIAIGEDARRAGAAKAIVLTLVPPINLELWKRALMGSTREELMTRIGDAIASKAPGEGMGAPDANLLFRDAWQAAARISERRHALVLSPLPRARRRAVERSEELHTLTMTARRQSDRALRVVDASRSRSGFGSSRRLGVIDWRGPPPKAGPLDARGPEPWSFCQFGAPGCFYP